MIIEIVILTFALVALFCFYNLFIDTITVYDFQKALLYHNGKFVKILNTGKHKYLKSSGSVYIFDTRKTIIILPGQEVLTKDNVSIKISITGFFTIVNPEKAKHNSEDYRDELYNHIQTALRELISTYELETLLEQKNLFSEQLMERTKEQASFIGLQTSGLTIRDIMLPAAMKKAFSGIVEAKKEAQIQLEKARGEDAVLRKLANSSKMYEKNPSLLYSRVIQTLSSNKNNTIIFGSDVSSNVVGIKNSDKS